MNNTPSAPSGATAFWEEHVLDGLHVLAGNRELVVTVALVGAGRPERRTGEWVVMAFDAPAEAHYDGILDDHAHELVTLAPSRAEARRCAEEYAASWLALRAVGLNTSERCGGCNTIASSDAGDQRRGESAHLDEARRARLF